ncbi:MAG: hypothetical protein PHO56_03460 [Patescibacteria group bacterium]|nr:hypothetical protein [Patescibacteria group bacterium]
MGKAKKAAEKDLCIISVMGIYFGPFSGDKAVAILKKNGFKENVNDIWYRRRGMIHDNAAVIKLADISLLRGC